MPRDHQAKYAEVHPTLEDVTQQVAAFQQYYATDKRNGTLKKLLDAKKPKKKSRDLPYRRNQRG
eukprot:scaffold64475_cov103-Cyclotella_meneghiniana.AAC.1